MLEPWYHFNAMEQAIGRAIRNQSHSDIPPEQRNVTIYLHCATSDDDTQTIDERMYEISIDKLSMMAKVSHTLAKNAVDCKIQSAINYIKDSSTLEVKDSYGNPRTVTKGDDDFSARCGFSKCEISCGDGTGVMKPSNFQSLSI